MSMQDTTHRRDFLKSSTLAVAGAALAPLAAPAVHAAGDDVIKVGIVGCGGRGTGAGEDVLRAAKGVEIVALADYFRDDDDRGVMPCRQKLQNIANDEKIKSLGNKVSVPDEHCFTGLDAYQKLLAVPGLNYVILTTPPGFRPTHLQAAIAAGKHVFTEKPVAVDGPGVRTCLDAYEQANNKKLCVAAGTQRRHQTGYLETVKALHNGEIGDIVGGRCYWNGGPIWFRRREARYAKDLDYQIHNWYHFVWLCGDHVCEQHVHNLDVINWVTNSHPTRCLGMGGRVLPCADPQNDGHIFNFFAIDFEYPSGAHVLSMCRQVAGTDGNLRGINGVSEAVQGTKGWCQVDRFQINGKPFVARDVLAKATNPYVQEHTDLIASIRNGAHLNELKNVAESTLTAIMGRTSAYTGKAITWEQALNSQYSYAPAKLDPDASIPIPPVAVPGKTQIS